LSCYSLIFINVQFPEGDLSNVIPSKLFYDRRDKAAWSTPRSPYTGPRDLERTRKMYDLGLKVTLSTDDPAKFNSGYMNQMLMGAVEGSGYTKEDLLRLMRNAFEGSWLPQESKDRYIKALNEYAEQRMHSLQI